MQPLQKLCDASDCYYNTPRAKVEMQKGKIENITCPLCLKNIYCSKRCRDSDWVQSHKQRCIANQIVQNGNYEQHARCRSAVNEADKSMESDKASTLKSIRRKPEDFEIIYKKGRTDLGKGSYGQVKLVRDNSNGKEYAMKIMFKRQIFEYCTIENLKREIKIQRKLQHPNITKLFHYFEDKENVYLILEYAENGSLFSYLRKRTFLPEMESFVYFFQTCLGIDYLHKNHILHRDLKPENLLLDKDGNIKLCDFGWSAETRNSDQKRSTFCGTYEYMAPEMIRNQSHDQSLDIWSLGILLFELLNGHAPFRGRSDHDTCESILQGTNIQFSQNVSQEAKNLIIDILKPKPTDRLKMRQIFDHPWMIKNSKLYQIDIWQFVYQPAQPFKKQVGKTTDQVLTQAQQNGSDNQKIAAQKKSEASTKPSCNDQNELVNMKKQIDLANPYSKNTQQPELENYKGRISRVSNRNEIIQHQKENHLKNEIQKQPQYTFMDRVFMAFGCLKRDKIPQNIK